MSVGPSGPFPQFVSSIGLAGRFRLASSAVHQAGVGLVVAAALEVDLGYPAPPAVVGHGVGPPVVVVAPAGVRVAVVELPLTDEPVVARGVDGPDLLAGVDAEVVDGVPVGAVR